MCATHGAGPGLRGNTRSLLPVLPRYQEPEKEVMPTAAAPKGPPVSQPSKAKTGGGLFSDEDEENGGGGLFGGPAAKPAAPVKTESKAKPKPKSTISLFDEDEQDEEEQDFFAPAASKPSR